ncbi:MAG TPA: carbamoyltransferase C-terminal domain-containing protein [Gemmatimonadales bacterium]|nr:carbamoyltransferase C-terminal domain-containing protein [Gemmatimonadales bacterium]
MKILGISGFEGAIPFKRAHWPGLDEREYRISQGHDSAAVLVADGNIVAAVAEERINRKKHTGDFPAGAIRYCLREAGVALEEIDELAHGFDYAPYRTVYALDPVARELYREVYSREALLELVRRDLPGFPGERVQTVNHHLAHAASAAFTSGWDECLVVVIDGTGEAHSASVYHARGTQLDRLFQISALDSIGILYSLITLHLGFDFNADEYKIMGLAPYGDPARFRPFFEEAVTLTPDGGFRIPALKLNEGGEARERYLATRAFLTAQLGPARAPEDEIADVHRDVAAALQEGLDRAMLHLCGRFGARTGQRRLALAGGVALNCTANGRLLKSGMFDEIYVQPAAADDGAALGAALWRAAQAGEVKNERLPVPFLGPSYGRAEIDAALAAVGERVEAVELESLAAACAEAARLIAAGRVVAWYRGRMEFGPRALGHRSILADPGGAEMRDRINAMVKMREAFRPFAPAVTVEEVDRWFDVPPRTELPYMIMTVDVRPQFRGALPAITHVNGSARVQTVAASDNAEFHQLLRAVGGTTGREMVLNTSFNVKGQPIVNTPREALETFLGTGIEYLFLENILVRRAGSVPAHIAGAALAAATGSV